MAAACSRALELAARRHFLDDNVELLLEPPEPPPPLDDAEQYVYQHLYNREAAEDALWSG